MIWLCKDCGIDVHSTAWDGYMVLDRLWRRYGVAEDVLCLACFAHRLGRSLTAEDFLVCELNIFWKYNPLVSLLMRDLICDKMLIKQESRDGQESTEQDPGGCGG